MKEKIKKHWPILTCLLVLTGSIFYGFRITAENINLKKDLDYCEGNLYDLESQNEELNYRISELQDQIYSCQNDLEDCEYRKQNLYYELDDVQSELDNERWNNEW